MDGHVDPDTMPQDKASESATSRANVALAVVRLAGLSEAEYQAERKAAAREYGLSLAALDSW